MILWCQSNLCVCEMFECKDRYDSLGVHMFEETGEMLFCGKSLRSMAAI